jgi:hypothetical protein
MTQTQTTSPASASATSPASQTVDQRCAMLAEAGMAYAIQAQAIRARWDGAFLLSAAAERRVSATRAYANAIIALRSQQVTP